MLTDTCQRWELGRESRRPAGEVIRPSEYDVAPLGPVAAKAFVELHHYSGSCSPTAHPFGLWRRGDHVGTAVFGPLPSMNAHRVVFGGLTTKQAVTLGRLVLLDEVPGNGESYFVARCFEILRSRGIAAVESCADPEPCMSSDGHRVRPGHVGTIYQALNGRYIGRTNRASLRVLPDGSVLSNRTQGKVHRGERGQSTAYAQLEAFGATPIATGEDPGQWLVRWRNQLTRTMRHHGNHRYIWALDRRRRRDIVERFEALPYPKIGIAA